MRGPNIQFTYQQTMDAEAYNHSLKKFRVHLPSDDAFVREVGDQISRRWWDWWPTGPDETQCARAAYNVLKAGGLPLWGYGNQGEMLPGWLMLKLDQLANISPGDNWSVDPIP